MTRNFPRPKDILELFERYEAHLLEEAKNWPKVQYVGKDGDKKTDYPVLPKTMSGFKVWVYKNCDGKTIEQYFTNQEGLYDDYIGICSHVKERIRDHQITGGMVGDFNPSITQRLNNLAEHTKTEIKEQPLFPDE